MNNKKNGTDFEKKLCDLFAKEGMWSRLEYPSEDGSQPFDLKVIYRNNFYAFECKDCKNDYFDLNRVEENQRMALRVLFQNLFTFEIYFAFNFNGEYIFVEADKILDEIKFGTKRITKTKMKEIGISFNGIVELIISKRMW